MRISDWSSDVCASDLDDDARHRAAAADGKERPPGSRGAAGDVQGRAGPGIIRKEDEPMITTTTHSVEGRTISAYLGVVTGEVIVGANIRSEEHTSELQSLMRIPYAALCLK